MVSICGEKKSPVVVLMNRLAVYISTLGPIGKLPVAPGTWGSAAAVVLWWFVLSALELHVFWTVVVLVALVAVMASTHAERVLGRDARPIVIDEVVGQWIPLAICDKRLVPVALAFILFRLFDIVKPFPVNVSQKLKGGVGVVVDDLLAGGYSLLILVVLDRLDIV